MIEFLDREQVNEHLILPQTFDWDLIDQELGFNKIFKFIPQEVYEELRGSEKDTDQEIFRLLTKAAVHFCFVFNIPKIKVHISSTGIEQFAQDKLKVAPWWDVRDLGLSLLKIADHCFSEAIDLIFKDDALKDRIPNFIGFHHFLATPSQFQKYYSINNSIEVFIQLQQFIQQAIDLKVKDLIDAECFATILSDSRLSDAFKAAIVYYALHYASLLPNFTFLQNAVVIQYEELPWQKSQVLDGQAKLIAGQNFLYLADNSLKIVTNHIKQNSEDFPCYTKGQSSYKILKKKSGLYL